MKIKYIVAIASVVLFLTPTVSAWWIFGSSIETQNTFNESELKKYLPVVTNDIIPDKTYGRIVESNIGNAYCYMFYWYYQSGFYKLSEHNNDWEFIIVYTNTNGVPYQINYDTYHYYIGRLKQPEVYNKTHAMVFVGTEFHNFLPDLGIRQGNVAQQINRHIGECNDSVLLKAEQQVGFDHKLFDDPFAWQDADWTGRYTAFNSWWKAFLVVSDKKFDFINFEDAQNWFTKWL